MSHSQHSTVLTDADRMRLRDYLERLGEQKVRLMSGVNCRRYFGNWQAAEVVEAWLNEKAVARQGALPGAQGFWTRFRTPGPRP